VPCFPPSEITCVEGLWPHAAASAINFGRSRASSLIQLVATTEERSVLVRESRRHDPGIKRVDLPAEIDCASGGVE
jgi:hypothetical protein